MLIKAQAFWFERASSLLVVEAEAVRVGVQLAMDMGIRKVI
jgi:hypothetical protein